MELGMHVLCMLNISFQAHIPYNLILMYLWLPLELIALYGIYLDFHWLAAVFTMIVAASNKTLCLHIG